AENSYVLGASFGVTILENRYRQHVVQNFERFLQLDNCLNMLTKWCPEKLSALIRDAMTIQNKANTQLQTELQAAKRKWEDDKTEMDKLISHCKGVGIFG